MAKSEFDQFNVSKIKRDMSLQDYVSIFNFLSKVIYCSSKSDSSDIPFKLRRLCCTEMIPYHSELEKGEEFIEKYYTGCKAKVENLYCTRINDSLIVSLADCKLKFDKEEDRKYLFPFTTSNSIIFSDDSLNITVFVDRDLYTGIDFSKTKSFNDECGMIINNESKYFYYIMESITDYFTNSNVIGIYNRIMGNLIYSDPNAKDKMNKVIDKLLQEACTQGTEYIAIENDNIFRNILDEYYNEEYEYRISIPTREIKL